ncbi:DUF349 domain-containing protein [Hymenobacter taeanensis]|uniref:DUF349 domain-containing protein n=1 Tax=Hymenobacter taeanensis TaxID=2735321 RepID=A0A6M6BKY0_9BACT|nr:MULTISPECIES: DUF349 domain-containing protein [Hymenobacter]QJX48657.1 DUF349 domain-containing protein [Hymenobacter taeanensis]UOQ81844.1 DUF349 domain-containing protein [Hymenobacter sp. 5414T-23]
MLPENDNTAPTNANDDSESPMSILERRLAEISAKQDPANESVAPPAEPSGAVNNVPAAPIVPETDSEQPSHTVAADTNEPSGNGPAEATPSPEETAAAESATHIPTGTTGTVHSAGEARSLAHYGTTEPSPDASQEEAPEPEAPHVKPVVEVTLGENLDAALEQAPAVASLHTSSDAAATDEEEEYVPEATAPDFASLDLTAQTAYLQSLLQRPDARQNRKQIFDLYRQYDTNIQNDRAAARQRASQPASNDTDDVAYTGPSGYQELTKSFQEFRDSRVRDAKAEDEQRAKNLAHKQYLLSQLRQLVESAETKDSSTRIKALQNDWKATGPVPQKDTQELWNNYHALLDIFYNNRGLFFEMKELDRRRNQEAKEVLITRAEALQQQPSINKALQELRQLHEEWKHIGPVPNEHRETLWQRFLLASEKVHDRKKEFLSTRSAQENANLERKTALLAQLQPFGEFQTDRVNEWRSKTDELQKLKEEWDAAGLVPREKAEQMNKQFWGAYKGFFQRKNQFFKALDEEKNANLKRKLDLCEQAEAALQSPNWEDARETVIRLQKEWKLIGRVPEKQSDKVWNRFRTACDSFFDRKKEEVRQREQQVQQASREQVQHLDSVAETVAALSADTPGTLEGFRQLVTEWRNFDSGTSRGSERTEEKFQALMAKYLDAVPGLSYAERTELLFTLQIERLKLAPDAQQQLYKKEQLLRREINELENDISTLRTNLEFFARSKNAGQLREEYQGRIDEAQARIDTLKKQLRMVRS